MPETSPLPAEPEEEDGPQVDNFVNNVVVTPRSVIEIADEVGHFSFVFTFLWSWNWCKFCYYLRFTWLFCDLLAHLSVSIHRNSPMISQLMSMVLQVWVRLWLPLMLLVLLRALPWLLVLNLNLLSGPVDLVPKEIFPPPLIKLILMMKPKNMEGLGKLECKALLPNCLSYLL